MIGEKKPDHSDAAFLSVGGDNSVSEGDTLVKLKDNCYIACILIYCDPIVEEISNFFVYLLFCLDEKCLNPQ